MEGIILDDLRFLFRRDGLAGAGKAFRCAISPKAWRRLRERARERRLMEDSGLVDRDWYRREYPEVAETGIDPIRDFLDPAHVSSRMPNPDFDPREYAAANFDVKADRIPAVWHYVRHGMREGRPVSLLECAERPFPDGAEEFRKDYPAAPAVHRRTAVFAAFSGDGRIGKRDLFYLRGLKEVVDNVVFVANCPIFPEEAAKLEGLARLAVFRHHGCYDFGSYKAGWFEAKALGLLEPDVCDELVVCNDSCYGPVFPFSECFAVMAGRPCDFWGMALARSYGRKTIQSYFYVFRKAVLEGPHLDRWFGRLDGYRDRGQVIAKCETVLTEHLERCGYSCDALVPESFHRTRRATPTKFPLTLMRDWRMPLVKVKALRGDSLENAEETFAFLRRENPALGALIGSPPEPGRPRPAGGAARAARESHAESFARKVTAVRARAAAGNPVRVVFLSAAAGPLPWEPAFEALRRDGRFQCSVAAVPDFRISEPARRLAALRDVRAEFLRRFPEVSVQRVSQDEAGEWTDVAADADVVCWGTAENVSDFRHDPHWSVGRAFLPVLFFDRRTAGPYPLEKEFGRQNYAYFQTVFFADRKTFDLYVAHSLRGADNAVLAADGDFLRALAERLGSRRSCENRSETEGVP